jgi:Flp pilus assembly protein TadD
MNCKQIVLMMLLTPSLLIAEEGYDKAVSRYKAGDYKAVIEEVRILHDAGGNSYESHALCGFAYSKLDNFESASAHFFQAIKFKPEDVRIRADLIRLYLNHNRTKGALELATSTLEKFPDDTEIHFLYANVLFLRGKPKTALVRVEKLKSVIQDDPEIMNLEGKIYYSLGNYDKADVSLKWASALDKNSASIWNNLALVQEKLYLTHLSSGKKSMANDFLKEAKDSIQKAISLDAKENSISTNAERILSYTNS